MIDNSVNAGPRAENGFALQRNTALYILLTDYDSKFRHNKYFICLEHHDDFLFCFLDDNDNAKKIDAYQSKKKSPTNWSINNELAEIINKILDTGNKLIKDSIPKSTDYAHVLHFSTNSSIKLEDKKSKKSISISEENCLVAFKDLDDDLKKKIKKSLTTSSIIDNEAELEHLHFLFVDLPRTDEQQRKILRSELEDIFGTDIVDTKAAIDTLISLFEVIEKTYNQGNTAKLLDKTKRVSSDKIDQTIRVITTKSKAFDFWRNEERGIRKVLGIKPYEKEEFEFSFQSAFDLFKSKLEQEHKNVLQFVGVNYLTSSKTQEEEVVLELYDKFKLEKATTLKEIDLKAAIYAAYFEVMYKKA
ncbi:hypothetical protein [Pontibacter actiniarum]|uniref:CD-NTase associated protein 4-like DNA endonuclease domain-containing protein n=1 Tax=Pontibacter actiniarum TaxID=323450 RepID=A0A1X9YUT0_9BACT|nr:hypothetical protein [Pontibacter actiniarum]ARS36591.1 hypothetical protein CA264_14835 [Pontibacter actiniarum]